MTRQEIQALYDKAKAWSAELKAAAGSMASATAEEQARLNEMINQERELEKDIKAQKTKVARMGDDRHMQAVLASADAQVEGLRVMLKGMK